MTKEQVLQCLIKLFKNENAVDPNLSDSEIAQIKLHDIDYFRHELENDRNFKKELLFKKMAEELKKINAGDEVFLSPGDYTIFNRNINIETLAKEIAENT